MTTERERLVATLRAALMQAPPMRLVVLFGSRAGDRARPESDLDVGIIPAERELPLGPELALQSVLSKATGHEVDLVRLDGDDLVLGREAATHGVLVHEERPGFFAQYRARALSDWLDFEESLGPARDRYLRRLAERGAR
jgi:predicted nucleotidyltransferase